MTQAQVIEGAVDQYLGSIGITFAAHYVCETCRDDWMCDEWSVLFERDRKTIISTTFRTGIGLRKKAKQLWVKDIPVKPNATSVLYSLLIDAEAIDKSFVDWCDDFGYSNDSLKALNTYNACCVIGQQVRKMFSQAELTKLRDLLQDY